MDIRKISLYLSGKLPPYHNKANFWRFRRIFKQDFPEYIDDTQIEFIQKQWAQTEDFFFMILDDIQKDYKEWSWFDDFVNSLIKLEIPYEILWVSEAKEYTWNMYNAFLHKTYWEKPSTNQKWELFERLCFDILQIVGWFTNVKKAWDWWDWGIDITSEYKFPVWTNTSFILWFFWQAKYKTRGNISEAEINRLTTTISNDTNQKYQWVFYFTNTFYAPKAREALENISHWTSNRKSFRLDWDEILQIISKNDELMKKYTVI